MDDLRKAVVSGDDIRIALDAVDSYEESLGLSTVFVEHGTGIVGGLSSFAQSGFGDKFGGVQDYTVHATFLADRRVFMVREQRRWSRFLGRIGSVTAPGRYGYYRWKGAGRTRNLIASSSDLASLAEFQQDLLSGRTIDFKIRVTFGSLTYVCKTDSILYIPKISDAWLMAERHPPPAWTIKTRCMPVPIDKAEIGSFVAPSALVIADAIVHSRGAISLHGLPVRFDEGPKHEAPINLDSLPAVVDVLGPVQ